MLFTLLTLSLSSSKRRGPDSRLRLPLLQVSIKAKHDG